MNISFLNSDYKTDQERLTAQNTSLMSIYKANENNYSELLGMTNNTEIQLQNMLNIFTRVNNSLNNLNKAMSMLIDLEQQLYFGFGQTALMNRIMQENGFKDWS